MAMTPEERPSRWWWITRPHWVSGYALGCFFVGWITDNVPLWAFGAGSMLTWILLALETRP